MNLFLLILGFWGCCCIKNEYLIFSICFIYGIFLWFRFKKGTNIILWIGLCILSVGLIPIRQQAQVGEYTVTQVKNKYCLASNSKTTVVLYDSENANFGDVYQISSFEEIHSIRNLHQFCFQDYINSQNVFEQAKEFKKIKCSSSIQSKLYSYFMKKEHANYYKLYLYGMYNDGVSDVLSRLSLPLLCSLYWLEKVLKKFFGDVFPQIVVLGISIVFGFLFTFKISLLRYIVFKVGRLFFSKWEHSFGFSMFCLLCLQYNHATDFSIVFPISIQFINHFVESKRMKQIYSSLCLIFFQFLYFHEIDIFFTLFFSILRNWNSILFLLCLFVPFLFQILSSIAVPFLSISIHFVPDFIFICLFFMVIYSVYKKKYKEIWLVLWILYPCMKPYIDPFFHVYMIDIGQGDCTLIVEPFCKSIIMIDCGQNRYRDNVEEIIFPFLKNLQIDHLDYLIVTHDDFDHSGGKENLLKQIDIHEIVTSSSQEIKVEYPFYSLLENRKAEDENDGSIISYFTYDNLKYLWMGDASIQVENQLLEQYNIKADVVKLGHHGSNTSSSYHFLESIGCRIGLISVGYNNSYHHPSNRVIQDLNSLHINVFETKDVGTIHIYTWKWFSFIETANGLFTYTVNFNQ